MVLPVTGLSRGAPESSLVHRHHLCADAWRKRLPMRGHGLVFTSGAGLVGFQYNGDWVLLGGSGESLCEHGTSSRNLQH